MAIKYIFDVKNLQIGDVLLSLGDTKGSRAIARLTDGPFSHAMVYVGNSVIHAMPDGVYSKNPQRMPFDSPDQMIALRLRPEESSSAARDAAGHARAHVGSLYSIPQAGATKVLSNSAVQFDSSKQFCSRLVAHCYRDAGVSLVKNLDFCSPNDIAKSPLLVAIDDYYKVATEADLEVFRKQDPNLEIQKATFDWLNKVRSLARRKKLGIVARQGDVASLLIENKGYDKVISMYIKSTDYLNRYDVDREINAYRYDAGLFIKKFSVAYDIFQAIEEERGINLTEISLRSTNVAAVEELYRKFPLEYFYLELQLCKNILREAECRLAVLDEVEKRLAIPAR